MSRLEPVIRITPERVPSSRRLECLRALLERALYDLDHGWPDAARDAVGRALELLRERLG